MDGLRTLLRDVTFSTLGVPASITPPAQLTLASRIIWLESSAQVPPGAEMRRSERQRSIAISTQDGPLSGGVPSWEGVPQVPRGTLIEIETDSGIPESWLVDGIESVHPKHVRAIVVPA